MVKRTTVYFDPVIHKALKLKSKNTSQTISELVHNAVKKVLAEDTKNIAAIKECTGESVVNYAEMVQNLKQDGCI